MEPASDNELNPAESESSEALVERPRETSAIQEEKNRTANETRKARRKAKLEEERRIEAACQDLGFSYYQLRKLKSFQELGKMLEMAGPIQFTHGLHLKTLDDFVRFGNWIEEQIEQPGNEGIKADLIRARIDSLRGAKEAADSITKLTKANAPRQPRDTKPTNKSFPPIVLHNEVQVNGQEATSKTSSKPYEGDI